MLHTERYTFQKYIIYKTLKKDEIVLIQNTKICEKQVNIHEDKI